MSAEDPAELGNRLEEEADVLSERAENAKDDADAARAQWRRKQADPAVPGATGDVRGSDEG